MTSWLEENLVDVIGLLTTLGLLGVTFWYAKTTRVMAATAQSAAAESARATAAAERSAEAALDAARVAQSQIEVEFEGRVIGFTTRQITVPTVEIRSLADSVVVQEVRVRRAFRMTAQGQLHETAALENVVLTAVGEMTLPRRLHKRERLHLTHADMEQDGGPLARFLLDVNYTFSENGGAGGTRQVVISEQ